MNDFIFKIIFLEKMNKIENIVHLIFALNFGGSQG